MSFELNFNLIQGPWLALNWRHLENRDWICRKPHEVITGFLRLSQALSFWRGECALSLQTKDLQLELQFVDLFQGDLSYQILDYGLAPIQAKKFKRLEYGRISAVDFQECVYAATTDLVTALGTKAYAELFGAAFAIVDYKRLAKALSRPNKLPEEGLDELEAVVKADGETSIEMIWESGGEDEEDFLSPEAEDKELVRRSEFAVLGSLIQRQKQQKKTTT